MQVTVTRIILLPCQMINIAQIAPIIKFHLNLIHYCIRADFKILQPLALQIVSSFDDIYCL
ncbi:hypothetical protein T4D_1502 [Trichinella pseudospiralis]|uniref:Uncharacterized protein n=1 Tax=Trichinella pseudospiralis TaxID=6337 RepID=A0A0V1G7N2_TRIPS|nr:hypothetical protein T4D_1502 [Trichinella pseudospiralis]